jgi:hypothetical protein
MNKLLSKEKGKVEIGAQLPEQNEPTGQRLLRGGD